MATEAKTATEVIVTSSVKVVALCTTRDKANKAVIAANVELAKGVKSEADRLGYDKDQAREMLFRSFEESRGLKTDAEKKQFRDTEKFMVSRVLLLAFPDKPAMVEKVLAFNQKNPGKAQRIGLNTLYEVARGNMTADQAINGKAKKKTKSALDTVSTPEERLQNSLAAVWKAHRIGAKDRIAREDIPAIVEASLDAYLGVKSKGKK